MLWRDAGLEQEPYAVRILPITGQAKLYQPFLIKAGLHDTWREKLRAFAKRLLQAPHQGFRMGL